jgi:hypothetical protein
MATRIFLFVLIVLVSAGCGSATMPPATNAPVPAAGTACTPGDQDPFVYRPARLQVINPCVRATGTVVSLSLEADGDVHMNLRLDEAYRGLLNAGNDHEDGNLIVEPVCQIPPMQAEAIRVCASDPNPDLRPLPPVGAHVWMEGRHVLDLQHYSWAELHPLYRWGAVNP